MTITYYTPSAAYGELAVTQAQVNAAIAWLQSNAATNEFASSLDNRLLVRGELSEKQWLAAVAASEGRYKRRSKKRKPAADAPRPAVAAKIVNDRATLSPAQRATARKAISRADGWKGYAAAAGINSGDLSKDVLYDAADALGVDVAAALAAHNAKVKAGNAAFDAASTGTGGGDVDWQRVRRIAREEVERRMDPVIKTTIVIDQGGVQTPVLSDDLRHPNFDKAFAALNCTDFTGAYLNVLLVGPAGTGKSYACRQMAKALGLEFWFQSIAMESYDILGYTKVNGDYKMTAALEAFQKPALLLLDEADAYDEKAVVSFNAGLANGEIALDDGTIIKKHPQFRCVAAANTMGLGATGDYTARNKLDLSTLSRFAVRVDWHYDAATELAIATAKGGDTAAAWAREVQEVRSIMARLDLPALADQRCIEAGAALLTQGLVPDMVRELTYLAALDGDQRSAVLNTANQSNFVKV